MRSNAIPGLRCAYIYIYIYIHKVGVTSIYIQHGDGYPQNTNCVKAARTLINAK